MINHHHQLSFGPEYISFKDLYVLRWAGGKRWLFKHLDQLIPKKYNNYHEPFLGGGSVFFKIQPKNLSFLSDINSDLINFMNVVKERPEKLYNYFLKYENNPPSFKNIKNDFNIKKSKYYFRNIKQGSRFLFLSNFSFNGIYRTNALGEYNVPYGSGGRDSVVTLSKLKNTSNLLSNSIIKKISFEKTISNIEKNDFVFIDPPYTDEKLNKVNMYDKGSLEWIHIDILIDFIKQIIEKRAFFTLTYKWDEKIEKKFSLLGKMKKLTRKQSIGGKKAERGDYEELVITNI